ncbi:unnamed protein product [Linum trigynum]|uniref:Reverse transcriptase Ty1/copia-type domain-containing protein n=1 Tax=Linum trigynum TaxID=586398 RepID=A0AAV2FD32_9ROSI
MKYLSTSDIERNKARLVAKGYTQREGIGYMDTFALVVKITIVRLFLVVAVVRNWHLHQLDINNAFLHGDLTKDVYRKLPQGVAAPANIRNPVSKLRRAIYGLKHASQQWFSKLSDSLL